jgi:hypothetical protein
VAFARITRVRLTPDNQDKVLALNRARPLHGFAAGLRVGQPASQHEHQSPEFRKRWPQFGKLADEIDPGLYEVVHTEQA